MPKSLALVNSVYHLLTVVNLQHLAPPGEETDLLVSDITPGLQDLIPRLGETGLFARVLPVGSKGLGERFPMDQEGPVARCLEEGEAHLRWALGEELEGEYRRVLFPNFDWLARLLACRYSCPFYWVEDGFSSYVIDFARPDRSAVNRHPLGARLGERTEAALLYEPRLAMRGDGRKNLPLPKLSRQDGALRELLNFVFAYHPPQDLPPFLFLEQSFRAENIRGNDLELMAQCQQAVGLGRFGVKSHPRNGDHLPQALGLSRKVDLSVPWELFLLNQEPPRPAVLTVCSNGALSGRLCLGLEDDTVMLYKLYTGKVLWKENQVLSRYLEAFRRQFAGRNYYVPETVFELRNVLKVLGGQYGG